MIFLLVVLILWLPSAVKSWTTWNEADQDTQMLAILEGIFSMKDSNFITKAIQNFVANHTLDILLPVTPQLWMTC